MFIHLVHQNFKIKKYIQFKKCVDYVARGVSESVKKFLAKTLLVRVSMFKFLWGRKKCVSIWLSIFFQIFVAYESVPFRISNQRVLIVVFFTFLDQIIHCCLQTKLFSLYFGKINRDPITNCPMIGLFDWYDRLRLLQYKHSFWGFFPSFCGFCVTPYDLFRDLLRLS